MNGSDDSAGDRKSGPESGYTYRDLPEDGHFRFRKCALCGAGEMKSETSFVGR